MLLYSQGLTQNSPTKGLLNPITRVNIYTRRRQRSNTPDIFVISFCQLWKWILFQEKIRCDQRIPRHKRLISLTWGTFFTHQLIWIIFQNDFHTNGKTINFIFNSTNLENHCFFYCTPFLGRIHWNHYCTCISFNIIYTPSLWLQPSKAIRWSIIVS